MAIRFLTTGGTIDDLEYSAVDEAPQDHKSLIPSFIEQARLTIAYTVEQLMAKDSKFVNDDDREKMAESCINAQEEQIVITHGTMTMPETAKYLGEKQIPKTIVLLGAAIPANRERSDALFNLGSAVTAVQTLDKGVYITMNGKVFSWENVRKDFEKGIFEAEQ